MTILDLMKQPDITSELVTYSSILWIQDLKQKRSRSQLLMGTLVQELRFRDVCSHVEVMDGSKILIFCETKRGGDELTREMRLAVARHP